ncbi:uncharacterized protein PAC_18016 [Phialocephala subalpina]|uniref:Uncharacterized protein n=1 Tax=Phialocephala subalpina TaxID=576137 RepID=A0A1L7XT20_9HELO|nr:uncharacterized protein PAC_18016 [Phialocephala subalpina]
MKGRESSQEVGKEVGKASSSGGSCLLGQAVELLPCLSTKRSQFISNIMNFIELRILNMNQSFCNSSEQKKKHFKTPSEGWKVVQPTGVLAWGPTQIANVFARAQTASSSTPPPRECATSRIRSANAPRSASQESAFEYHQALEPQTMLRKLIEGSRTRPAFIIAESLRIVVNVGTQPNEAAKILHFRSRLAYLTGDPITPPGQEWDTDIRKMAAQLQEALTLQESAEYIFPGDMELAGDWKDVKTLLWSTTCQLPELSNESRGLPIHFLMYRNNSRWKISKGQLEATLGLWWWSLKQGDDQPNLFTEKIMLVEESKKMEYKSVIRLWVTQKHTAVSERAIQFPHPMPINSPGSHEVSTSQPSKLYLPTTLSVSTKALLGLQNPIRDAPGTESESGVLLAMETRSSPLQMIAQDIFTLR